MKRVMVGIFAHPDDEAFGPSGTLLKLAAENYDIHLILLTDGEAGTNLDNVPDLASVRLEEWQNSGKLIGVTSQTSLHYSDGKLDLVDADELTMKVEGCLKDIFNKYDEPVATSIMTFEPNGLTGHLDHIAASKTATTLFRGLENGNKDSLWYFCLNSKQAPLEATPYYHPQAREDAFINTTVDVTLYLEKKYQVIDCHRSQREDGAQMKTLGDELLSTECFRVLTDPES
jgi:LmbE family N-acetylglucosaminyl deacetylase